jgi:hypothetical protein
MQTIELQYPINIDGQKVTNISLRRPKVLDRLLSEKSTGTEAEKEVRFIANLCGMAPDQIEQLDMSDYVRVQEALANFLS